MGKKDVYTNYNNNNKKQKPYTYLTILLQHDGDNRI